LWLIWSFFKLTYKQVLTSLITTNIIKMGMQIMMFNPPHPGETLKELYLDPLDLSISATARALNMTRSALSEIVNSRRGISPSVAIKLAKAFGGTAL
jgi:addiction module HigA family antidote